MAVSLKFHPLGFLVVAACLPLLASCAGKPADDGVPFVGVVTVTSPTDDVLRRTQLQLVSEGGDLAQTVKLGDGVAPLATTSGGAVWAAGDDKLIRWTAEGVKHVEYPLENVRPVGLWPRPDGGATVLLDLGTEDGLASYRHHVMEVDNRGEVTAQRELKAMVWAAGMCDDHLTMVTSSNDGGPGGLSLVVTRLAELAGAIHQTPVKGAQGVNVEPGALVCRDGAMSVAASRSDAKGRTRPGVAQIDMATGEASYSDLKDSSGRLYSGEGSGGQGAAWIKGGVVRPEYDGRLARVDPMSGKTVFSQDFTSENNAASHISISDQDAYVLDWPTGADPTLAVYDVATFHVKQEPRTLKGLSSVGKYTGRAVGSLSVIRPPR